ncbi:energy-coupling factor transporter transmembrane protein EcfT [Nesterenkonia sp. E16_7]|uniref:energy-coupling factor transporter transmembrane component T family protein n=1 Tax=unclassified Nesterenkonia TaxID=2629769 RepID=UPI001A9337EF|nr:MULTISPECIES: energy-coupling factor transporter transmembrane component T [unclassified Nesterenkonia]MBO0596244.1 energy-coupling factor transporter transmembrane protein EcfT [Nesterenkonia sp. E16_10]MBO0597161.1 energy-coupling factor transporter transmembrane protein EcfT [Nesterenkonia sp. E16_7]
MISLYHPGASLLHRTSAGIKLAGFALLALALFFLPVAWGSVGGLLVLPVFGYALAGLPARLLLTDLRRLLMLLVFLVVTQLIFLDLLTAATNTARVISIVLLAQVLTRTTEIESIIATAERLFAPLRRFGANPAKIGLAMALVLTSVGQLSAMIRQVRDAQRSRGVRLPPWSWVVPTLVLALKHADDVGDALTARGLEE